MSNLYFTADHHFSHYNILKYCKRPFVDTDEMEEVFVERYNEVVDKDDTVWILGDLMLGGSKYKRYLDNVIDKLPGQKHLVTGNHDRLSNRQYIDIGFSSVHTFFPLNVSGREVYLTHDPAQAIYNDKDYITAHVHNLWQYSTMDNGARCVNVGVDVWDYSPVSLDRLLEVLNVR